MKDIVIKEVNLEEALKVFKRIKEWDRPEAGTVEYCKNKIGNSNHIILAAYSDDENVGYLIGYDKDNSFYCWVAAVDENYRRMGIAKKLINEMFKLCKDHLTSYILLEVRANNIPAQKLYESFGFKIDGIRKNYYKNPDNTHEDAILMTKEF